MKVVVSVIYRKMFITMLMGVTLLTATVTNARSLRTPEGNMPLVHWAVVEATKGNMPKMIEIGSRVLASTAAKETGTYALYGALDVDSPDVMRLLEIYESNEAYRIHSTSEAFQQYRAERFPILKDLKLLEVNALALEQKNTGTGTVVYMRRLEINPVQLAKYQQLAIDESKRAVEDDDGVMGMFVTAEYANPNVIHIMEIYKDKTAYERYINSTACNSFLKEIKPMIITERIIQNLPTKIVLTQKGA